MRTFATGFAIAAGVLALTLGGLAPASAEFFGCHDRPGQLLYSYNGPASAYHGRSATRYSRAYTDAYAAQSRRYRVSHSRTYSGSSRYWTERSRW